MIRSHRTEGVTYTCRGPGALLFLPCGGVREDAIHKKKFQERIRDNAESWFNWSRDAGLPVNRMDDLILVTGCTLVTSYASAVLDDHIADAQISLVSRPLNNGGTSFVWSNIGGTIEYHDSQLNPVCLSRLRCLPCIDFFHVYNQRILYPHLRIDVSSSGASEPSVFFSGPNQFELRQNLILTTLGIMKWKTYK